MQQNTPKILIISSDTGGGHRSAALALVEGVNGFGTAIQSRPCYQSRRRIASHHGKAG